MPDSLQNFFVVTQQILHLGHSLSREFVLGDLILFVLSCRAHKVGVVFLSLDIDKLTEKLLEKAIVSALYRVGCRAFWGMRALRRATKCRYPLPEF